MRSNPSPPFPPLPPVAADWLNPPAAAIGIQAAWAVAIVIGGRILWNSFVSRLEIQGG